MSYSCSEHGHDYDSRCEICGVAKEWTDMRTQNAALREALERIRDCDWVITLPDRMDGVRDIARKALEAMKDD